ncbi:MAG: penicillin-binding transpeptidase domain-containing protein, partial [Lapillicoccus sp.]
YFCDYALQYVLQDPSFNATLGKTLAERKAKIYRGGYTVTTSLEPALAASARASILARVPEGSDVRGIKIGSAAVIIDPRTGQVRAMAQNTSYDNSPNAPFGRTTINWAVDKKYGESGGFQFGSTEKAFTLVAALENGIPMNSTVNAALAGPGNYHKYTSAELPNKDGCGLPRGQEWPVKNDGTEGGVMTLAQATANSVNTAFIALANTVGICKVRDVETRVGLHRADGTPIAPGPDGNSYPPDIILGGAEVSPMTVAAAYGGIANDGVHCTPDPILQITDATGKALPIPKPGEKNCTRVIDAGVAAGVAQLMTHVMTDGTGKGSKLANGRPSAGKTGTTNLNNDTWFVGYTPQAVTAVWTGTPLENTSALDNIRLAGNFYPVVYGLSISAPVWKEIMDVALAGQPIVQFPQPPANIIYGNIQPFTNVVGHTVADATASLAAQGFTATVGRKISSNYRPGIVAGTSPAGRAPVGTTVTLLISSGPAPQAPVAPPTPGQPGVPVPGTPPAPPPTP